MCRDCESVDQISREKLRETTDAAHIIALVDPGEGSVYRALTITPQQLENLDETKKLQEQLISSFSMEAYRKLLWDGHRVVTDSSKSPRLLCSSQAIFFSLISVHPPRPVQ